MKHVTSVAGRELRSLFVSPVAYGVMSLFAVLAGMFFILQVRFFDMQLARMQQFQAFEELAQMNLNDQLISYFYGSMSAVLLFLIPAVTMGLFASEKTNGTQELLLTSPLTAWDIVLGKFVAGAAFIAVLVGLVALFPLLLFLYGDPEVGKTLTGLLALLLVGWTYVAIGCFASSITRSQVIALFTTLVFLIGMMMLPVIAQLGVAGGGEGLGAVLRYLATDTHFGPLSEGLVDTGDLAYFAVVIGSFLLFTKASVESVRWR